MNESQTQGGREAASRGEWQNAYALLMRADADQAFAGPDLTVLAEVAYAAGHLDVAIESWERAHAASLQAGDRLAAAGAATRVAMHLLFDTALLAPVRGWIKRAERLLESHEETPVHAWLAIVRNYERLLSGDFVEARQWARRAIELGTRHEPAVAAIGRVAEARSLILEGGVERGLALLDEAAVATVSGELDPFATGIVYCEVICGLQGVGQYDLAEQWTQAMERWRQGRPVGSIHGRCRVHRAEILRLRGFHVEAEKEAMLACDELRPYLGRELGWPLTELGRIRLRTGDLGGAEEALLAAHQAGWDPQPGLAMLALAKGDVLGAAASIQDALEHPMNVPSKELPPNTDLRRVPLLDAQVEIAIAAGNLELARRAAHELQAVATSFRSKSLAAGAARALGSVGLAEGDPAGARRDFQTAILLWAEVGGPYETALARMGLGQAHRLAGNEDRALLEFRAARGDFERVGALMQAERAAKAAGGGRGETQGFEPLAQSQPLARALGPAAASCSERNVFSREGEYWCISFGGRTTRLRDTKGLRYLALLLANPGREHHVFELVAAERGWTSDTSETKDGELAMSGLGDAGPMLDARAKAAYRRRIAEIDEDMEEAQSAGDAGRSQRAQSERDFVLRELSRAVGLGGRERRAGSASERARVSVTRAIRFALARIGEHNDELGEHLQQTVHTGSYCSYSPAPRMPAKWNPG